MNAPWLKLQLALISPRQRSEAGFFAQDGTSGRVYGMDKVRAEAAKWTPEEIERVRNRPRARSSEFRQDREAMQLANVIHGAAAIDFIALSLGHIYIGTIGIEGSYAAMRHGTVDETWAKEHFDIWYREVTAERGRPTPVMPTATARASPLNDGWNVLPHLKTKQLPQPIGK
jgi:hypothetical protein